MQVPRAHTVIGVSVATLEHGLEGLRPACMHPAPDIFSDGVLDRLMVQHARVSHAVIGVDRRVIRRPTCVPCFVARPAWYLAPLQSVSDLCADP